MTINLPLTYTIHTGDCLWEIAKKRYGFKEGTDNTLIRQKIRDIQANNNENPDNSKDSHWRKINDPILIGGKQVMFIYPEQVLKFKDGTASSNTSSNDKLSIKIQQEVEQKGNPTSKTDNSPRPENDSHITKVDNSPKPESGSHITKVDNSQQQETGTPVTNTGNPKHIVKPEHKLKEKGIDILKCVTIGAINLLTGLAGFRVNKDWKPTKFDLKNSVTSLGITGALTIAGSLATTGPVGLAIAGIAAIVGTGMLAYSAYNNYKEWKNAKTAGDKEEALIDSTTLALAPIVGHFTAKAIRDFKIGKLSTEGEGLVLKTNGTSEIKTPEVSAGNNYMQKVQYTPKSGKPQMFSYEYENGELTRIRNQNGYVANKGTPEFETLLGKLSPKRTQVIETKPIVQESVDQPIEIPKGEFDGENTVELTSQHPGSNLSRSQRLSQLLNENDRPFDNIANEAERGMNHLLNKINKTTVGDEYTAEELIGRELNPEELQTLSQQETQSRLYKGEPDRIVSQNKWASNLERANKSPANPGTTIEETYSPEQIDELSEGIKPQKGKLNISRHNGLSGLNRVKLTETIKNGIGQIEGYDSEGRLIKVLYDPNTGKVLEYYRNGQRTPSSLYKP